MKKFLLFAAAAFVAASASAELFPQATEPTAANLAPAGYDFNSYGKDFVGFQVVPGIMNWNMANHWVAENVINGDYEIGDGLIILSGPSHNNNADACKGLNDASRIVDFGGTLGKCLVINGSESTFNAKFKELTGKDLDLPNNTVNDYLLPFFHFDPTTLKEFAGVENAPLRCRIEFNIYSDAPATNGAVFQPYINDDENNVRPNGSGDNEAAARPVPASDFAYRWADKDDSDPNDEATWDAENEAGVWNPNRFMVYEWDFDMAGPWEEPYNFSPRIKCEIPSIHQATLIIRSIKVYAHGEDTPIVKDRKKTWNTYTIGDNVGIENIVADENAPVEYFNLQGVRVANPENGIFIRRQGAKATKVVM